MSERQDENKTAANQAHAISDLIRQLDGGSATAEARLVTIANGPVADRGELAGSSELDETTAARRQIVLNELAAAAAAGSAYCLELLLRFVVERELAVPAITRVVQSQSAIDDVQQDVLVAVADSIHRFRGEANFTTWLFTLARNRAIAHVRKSKPTTPLRSGDSKHLKAGGGTGNAPRHMSSLVAERDRLRDAVDALPAKYRDIVILRDIEGRSFAEIAELQDLEISTVRTQLSRGRSMLASKLT